MTTITRYKMGYEQVEVPEGYEPCSYCKGRGQMSKYDEGWNSLVHSPDLAALHDCWTCGGAGYVWVDND